MFILRICRVLQANYNTNKKMKDGRMVPSLTFAALIRPWTQSGILEAARSKILKNRTT